MFKEVKELQAEGLNISQISKKLDIARQTVRKYMGCDTLPKRASKERLPYYLYDTYVEEEYRHGKDLFFMIYDLGAVATGDNYLDVNIYVIVPVWVLLLFLS